MAAECLIMEILRCCCEQALQRGGEVMSQLFDKTGITDDAMVVEEMGNHPVHMFPGSYMNIKITNLYVHQVSTHQQSAKQKLFHHKAA